MNITETGLWTYAETGTWTYWKQDCEIPQQCFCPPPTKPKLSFSPISFLFWRIWILAVYFWQIEFLKVYYVLILQMYNFGEILQQGFCPPPQNWDLFSNFPQFPVILPCLNLCSLFLTNWVPKGGLCFDPPNLPIWWILQQGFGFFSLKGSVRYFWCWTYVKWGYIKFHPLKGFFATIIRSAVGPETWCSHRLGVYGSHFSPYFPLSSPYPMS